MKLKLNESKDFYDEIAEYDEDLSTEITRFLKALTRINFYVIITIDDFTVTVRNSSIDEVKSAFNARDWEYVEQSSGVDYAYPRDNQFGDAAVIVNDGSIVIEFQ